MEFNVKESADVIAEIISFELSVDIQPPRLSSIKEGEFQSLNNLYKLSRSCLYFFHQKQIS